MARQLFTAMPCPAAAMHPHSLQKPYKNVMAALEYLGDMVCQVTWTNRMCATSQIPIATWVASDFAVEPHGPTPSRGPLEVQLEALKVRLLEPLLAKTDSSAFAKDLLWAANEAAALAWYTRYPLLVLPALLDEKVQVASKRWRRQEQIRAGKAMPAAA